MTCILYENKMSYQQLHTLLIQLINNKIKVYLTEFEVKLNS